MYIRELVEMEDFIVVVVDYHSNWPILYEQENFSILLAAR